MKKKNNNEAVKRWIDKAEGDFGAASDLFAKRRKRQLFVIAFHCQQAMEKYLKAFLIYYRIKFPKKHDLCFLLNLFEKKEPFLSSLKSRLEGLSPYAIEVRYPGEDPTYHEVKEAIKITRLLRKIFLKRFKELL